MSAFLEYYLLHPFEVNLGLYAFRGLKRQGVGRNADRVLNEALWKVLRRIADPLAEVRGRPAAEVRPLVALLFSQMIGALVLQLAGRLDFLQIDPPALLRILLAHLWTLRASPLDVLSSVDQPRAKRARAGSKLGKGRK